MRELAILVPSRGRSNNINKVIGAWDFTNAWDHADLVVIVDLDDVDLAGYRRLQEMTRHPDTDEPLFRMIEMAAWMPMVHKLNMVAKDLAEGWPGAGDYFALGFAGDDHLPQTIGWAATYLEYLHKPGVAMVYGDDGYQGKKLSTEWAVSTEVVRALGRMVPAPVDHMYCDNSMMDLYGGAGLMLHLPQVRIEHMHPMAGKARPDAQYDRVNSSAQFRRDRDKYQSWKNGQLSEDLAKLKALRPDGRPERLVRRERKTVGKGPFPHYFKQVRGATPLDIEITLADLAMRIPRSQEIVELGVFQGKTSLVMAWAASQANGPGNGAHVTAIDAWDLDGNTYDSPFTDAGSEKWARYWVHSLGYANAIQLVKAFSHEVGATWTGKPVGLLFVDGDHSYEGARRDIETWAPHLAPGAIIAVDDYEHPDWPGVKQAVDTLVDEGVLAPIELYHERLAVTRLAEGDHRVTAVTSEGVLPSPSPGYRDEGLMAPVDEPAPSIEDLLGEADVLFEEDYRPQPADTSVSTDLEKEWRQVDPEGVAALEASARLIVGKDELKDVPAGTKIGTLNLVNLKALAKHRGIVLGVRKDKRDLILQALRDGK